jgi:hypothetical protein
MENTKITKRDYYNDIIKAMTTGEFDIDPELIAQFCKDEIALLDKKAAKAKERNAAKAAEADTLLAFVEAALSTDEFKTIKDITDAVLVYDPDATTSKVTNRLTKLINAEIAEKQEVSVTNANGTKAKRQGYRLCK